MARRSSKKQPSFAPYVIGTFLTILIIFMTVFSFSWADFASYTRIATISMKGQSLLNSDEYLKDIAIEDSISILDLDIREIHETLEENPFVKAARVSRRFPKRVIIEVMERQPLAWVNSTSNLYIDTEGYVLPYHHALDEMDLPIMSNFNPAKELYPEGELAISQPVRLAGTLLNWMVNSYPSLYDGLSEIRLNPSDDYELVLESHPTRIILGKEKLVEKLQVLSVFEETLHHKRSLTDYTYLDLRYHNQVIAKERRR